MSSFNKKFDGNANNIVTNTIVFPGVEIERMTKETPRFYSEKALWDTGAQVTVISEKVVKSLGLKPYGKGMVIIEPTLKAAVMSFFLCFAKVALVMR